MTDFKNGHIKYEASFRDLDGLDLTGWDDGFAAFSNDEFRLEDLGGMDLKALFDGRVENVPKAEGYLMELGLWRCSGTTYEELSIEREDDGFYVQRWTLNTQSVGEKESLCFWRHAKTGPRGNSLFAKDGQLKSVEVVVPENRLHFFITVTGDDN